MVPFRSVVVYHANPRLWVGSPDVCVASCRKILQPHLSAFDDDCDMWVAGLDALTEGLALAAAGAALEEAGELELEALPAPPPQAATTREASSETVSSGLEKFKLGPSAANAASVFIATLGKHRRLTPGPPPG